MTAKNTSTYGVFPKRNAMIELVELDGQYVFFACMNKAEDVNVKYQFFPEIPAKLFDNDTKMIPPDISERLPFVVPKAPTKEEIEEFSKLTVDDIVKEIEKFIRTYVELQSDNEYTLLATWVVYTWLYDAFETSPYICIMGARESGKTRLMEILSSIAYRSFRSSNISIAALVRDIEEYHITLFVDEGEYQLKDEFLSVFLSGSRRKDYYTRVGEDGERERFETFSPKVFGTRNPPSETLLSRCFVINMLKSQTRFPHFSFDDVCIEKMRKMLCYLRITSYIHTYIHTTHTQHTEREVPFNYKNNIMNNIEGRLKEISEPLLEVLRGCPSSQKCVQRVQCVTNTDKIISYLEEYNKKHKLDEESESEALVLEATMEWLRRQSDINDCKPTINDIADEINIGRSQIEQVTTDQIGKIIKGRFGFKNRRIGTRRGFYFDWTKFKKLCYRYNVDIPSSIKSTIEKDTLFESKETEEDRLNIETLLFAVCKGCGVRKPMWLDGFCQECWDKKDILNNTKV